MKSLRSIQRKATKKHARTKDYKKRKNVFKYRPVSELQPYEKPRFSQKRKYLAEQSRGADGEIVSKVISRPVFDKKGAPVLEQVGVKIKYFKRKSFNRSMELPKSRKYV